MAGGAEVAREPAHVQGRTPGAAFLLIDHASYNSSGRRQQRCARKSRSNTTVSDLPPACLRKKSKKHSYGWSKLVIEMKAGQNL